MTQVSIILAAHNEGELLWKTVDYCQRACTDLDYEVLVADDASEDASIRQLRDRFPEVAVHRLPERYGVSTTKDYGAQCAVGDVLVFLDAHCKPEPNAIARLVDDVWECDGEAIITPTIGCLDPLTWTNDVTVPGQGYIADLENFTSGWMPIARMRPHGRFYESPNLIGCCVIVAKRLYEKLWGFDRNMYMWGVEDVDFGVKSWLMGYPILHDPVPVIGHRFQKAFTTYTAPSDHLIANQLRMAYKIFPHAVWQDWLPRYRQRQPPKLWHRAWDIFTQRRGTAEIERVYLAQNMKCDVIEYAHRFGLAWPR